MDAMRSAKNMNSSVCETDAMIGLHVGI